MHVPQSSNRRGVETPPDQIVHVADQIRILLTRGSRVNSLVTTAIDKLSLRIQQLLQFLVIHAEDVAFGIAQRPWFDSHAEFLQVTSQFHGDRRGTEQDLQHVVHEAKFGSGVGAARVGRDP